MTNLVHGIDYETIDRIGEVELCRAASGRLFIIAGSEALDLDDKPEPVPFVDYEQPSYRQMFASKAERILRDLT